MNFCVKDVFVEMCWLEMVWLWYQATKCMPCIHSSLGQSGEAGMDRDHVQKASSSLATLLRFLLTRSLSTMPIVDGGIAVVSCSSWHLVKGAPLGIVLQGGCLSLPLLLLHFMVCSAIPDEPTSPSIDLKAKHIPASSVVSSAMNSAPVLSASPSSPTFTFAVNRHYSQDCSKYLPDSRTAGYLDWN